MRTEPGDFDLALPQRPPYDQWRIRAEGPSEPGPHVSLNYEGLKPYRMRLMAEVTRIVESENIPGPRELSARLRQLKMHEGEGEPDPIVKDGDVLVIRQAAAGVHCSREIVRPDLFLFFATPHVRGATQVHDLVKWSQR